MRGAIGVGPLALAALLSGGPLAARTVPTIDTEDADLGSQQVGDRRFHPVIGADVRNGDFARGSYDDDAASLDRLPVHAQLGFGWELHRDTERRADAWLVGTSSNGFHAPASSERTSPRGWYESNNLLGVVIEPAKGLRAGLAYAIKTSPNGVSATTHEASLTAAYEAEHGLGILHPSFAATVRPKGGHGVFTQAGIEPGFALSAGEQAAKLSVPLRFGVGWRGFYEAGSGDVTYGSAGLALSQPLALGGTRWQVRAEALAVVRDGTLRRLGSADAETSTVVPLVTIGAALAL
ncbi:hypothetical protein [Sphingomonas sp.]|uniref:hypothetical protein n=1 Tax=Sphingomonas sp. TaxID=28214 RepID=UPI003B00F000